MKRFAEEVVHDWEKIYDLPPHSSTLVNKEVPRRVDVGRRLAAFENGIHHDVSTVSGIQYHDLVLVSNIQSE